MNEIFAEYLDDQDDDPLTTFSNFSNFQQQTNTLNSILNNTQSSYNQGLISQTQLPTGRGIQTAFHSGITTPLIESMTQQQQQQEPIAKKPKIDTMNHYHQHQSTTYQRHPGQAVVPSNVSTSGAGITSRLGLSVSGGQVTLPQSKPDPQSSIQLPIGVGIRVGGVPSQSSGGIPNHGQQWNTNTNMNVQSNPWSGHNKTGVTGGVTDQSMAERRQRNREHAKRSRVRKKFLLESLQAEVRDLQEENKNLRMLVQQRIPQHAQQIIDECCMKSPLFEDVDLGIQTEGNASTELTKSDFTLITNLTSGQQNFVLSDPRLPDNPIVFASEGFYQLTGYTREQVLGRNCRFLQGPGTDPKAVDVIRQAVANGTDASTCILNYKADGTPFWNQFFVAALRDSDNCIVNYVSVF